MAVHACADCGLVHDLASQSNPEVEIARIEAETRLKIAQLEARADRHVAEVQAEADVDVAEAQAEAIVEALSVEEDTAEEAESESGPAPIVVVDAPSADAEPVLDAPAPPVVEEHQGEAEEPKARRSSHGMSKGWFG